MAVFAYKAIDLRQQSVSGTVAADTPRLARQSLRAQGLAIAELEAVQPEIFSAPGLSGLRLRRRIPPDAVAELWRNLAVLLQAGVPLVEALDVCRRQQRGPIERILRQLHESVRNGQPFAQAIADHRAIADDLTQAVVQIGQHSGGLPTALLQLAEYQARRRGTANRLATALIYPCILCIVGTAVVVFLMTYVIPQLVDVLASAGRGLPWPTRLLKGASDVLVEHGLLIGLAAFAIALALVALQRTQRGQYWRERLGLGLPVWGDLVRKSWVARIAGMLATMLRVDVRFTEALRIVRSNLSHGMFASELQRLEISLEAGSEIAAPLRQSKLMPPLVVHLLAVGQASGELPSMLEQIREHYEKEVQLALARVLAVLEPALILLLAVVIGFVVFATLLPILETTKVVS